jgi:hypothetical protein
MKVHDVETGSSGAEPSSPPACASDLEVLAIATIREHIRLLERDEILYAQWARAYDNPLVPRDVVQSLQSEYLARHKTMLDLHSRLSGIIDTLGHIPDIRHIDDSGTS